MKIERKNKKKWENKEKWKMNVNDEIAKYGRGIRKKG